MAGARVIEMLQLFQRVFGANGRLPFSICKFLWIRFWRRAAVYSGQIKALDDHRKVAKVLGALSCAMDSISDQNF